MADREFGPITPQYRQQLYELDMMMIEYREKCKIPGTEEYKAEQAANEFFSKPHLIWKSEEQHQ